MKLLKQFGCGERARGVAGALALCAALIAPALAEGRSTQGGVPPPPPAVSDDETVGTLPMVGGTDSLDFFRFLRDGRASFYLQGSLSEIQQAVVAVSGHNAVTVEFLDETGDNVRLTFHGRVSLILDRSTVEAGGITAGVMVPTTFGAGQSQFWLGATPSEPTGLSAGALPIPLTSLVVRGALDQRPLVGRMTSASAARTTLRIAASREYVAFTQTH
jgi:hypothetical protein